jgi:hypothetical protein
MKQNRSSQRDATVPALDAFEEGGMAVMANWPGAKKRQQPFIYIRVGQRVRVHGLIILRKDAK